MSKPMLIIVAPVQSCSGYGAHARDLARCLINTEKYDVKIWPIRWGDTSLNSLVPGKDDDIINRILSTPNLPKRPELSVQITIPPEFQNLAEFNIGITAGIETTVCNPSWIDGLNRMNLNIVPSVHAKNVFIRSEFVKNDGNGRPTDYVKLEKPVEVLFEGADTSIYKKLDKIDSNVESELSNIQEEFCFLYVGHWLQGNIGHDRKDVGMLIKTFLETFKNKENPPALILKTSSATFSVLDRNDILNKINTIRNMVGISNKLPNVYLLHGQLTDEEMNSLYNHKKIKAMVNLTKGEGFGRPLLEFTMCGKPIVVSGWSGHLDFLDKDLTMLLPGELKNVDDSSVNDFIIKDSKWFTVDYNMASACLLELHRNYNLYLANSKKQMYNNKEKFSLSNMHLELDYIMRKYVPEFPEEVQLKLPIKKITLPKSSLKTNTALENKEIDKKE